MTSTLPQQNLSLHTWFEQQANQTPEAIALTLPRLSSLENQFIGSAQLTYQDLNEQANQLAHYLRREGVGPDVLVGLCLERSIEMIVGILAILKAGGAYVPLDLVYPPERLAFILEDAQAPLLLTHSSLLEQLPANHPAQIIYIDQIEAQIASQPQTPPQTTVNPANLAYVIYTSGSTGRPKGVLITHANVTRLFTATEQWFHFSPNDVWSLFHSYAFDFSVWEIWGALLYGGRLVIVPYGVSRSPQIFYDLLQHEQVTILNQTPSAFRQLIRAEESFGVTDNLKLRTIIFGGESLDFHTLKPWFERHGDQTPQLVNMYGITETTVHVTYRPLTMADTEKSGSLIGEPIPDLPLHLLDDDLNPVSPGKIGELYVGGAGVGRGYLNRSELTEQRFIPDPFSDEPEARLYKSGDLGRYVADGDLEYLGRSDDQVKIRGFRIELGEIETALSRHPDIREAVVLAREDQPDQRQLVAYVTLRHQRRFDSSDLRRYLQETLPPYMLPTATLPLDQFPLTPNGKIDRQNLPSPQTDRPALTALFVAPRTDLEKDLAAMWQPLLDVDRVGLHDNFFELGGDSLKGALFINELQAKLGAYVYIVALFDAPTIAQFADYLSQHYPQQVAAAYGAAQTGDNQTAPEPSSQKIGPSQVARLRRTVRPLPPQTEPDDHSEKNPRAIFILTAPRSGSTLLRVMLGGHPSLFAPPELDLLQFNTLAERKAALTEGDSFRLSGAIRALMAAENIATEAAQQQMATYEDQNLSVKQFYHQLQRQIAPQLLVDKTTYYALDPETLKRAETDFDDPLYIHLTRHPYGTIHSFEEVRADRLYFKEQQGFSSRQIGEMTWLICHQNILDFLENIPTERCLWLPFETLVSQPETVMAEVCEFLGFPPHPDMLQPYAAQAAKMTDGLYGDGASRMLGDVKFHQHRTINREIADRWQTAYTEDFLGDMTWDLAESLGYERRFAAPTATHTPVAPIRRVARTDEEQTKKQTKEQTEAADLLTNLDQLSAEEVNRLLAQMLDERDK